MYVDFSFETYENFLMVRVNAKVMADGTACEWGARGGESKVLLQDQKKPGSKSGRHLAGYGEPCLGAGSHLFLLSFGWRGEKEPCNSPEPGRTRFDKGEPGMRCYDEYA